MNTQEQLHPSRKVYLKTFGCQMNAHDSERMLSHLKQINFSATENKNEADLILFNTCAIRDLSNMKFYSQLGEFKSLKESRPDIKIGVGGCVAQTEGKELIAKYPHLDFAFGTDTIDQLPDLVYRTYSGEDRFSVNTWDRSNDYSIETKITHDSPQAFVNIIKGCDKFCSYCIVPFTRGREKSRRVDEIVKDVSRLVEYQGIQEVTLLGQNVNSFGKEHNESLPELIARLDLINGLKLIRYTTSHPMDISDDLIQIHGTSKKLAEHLHLPVQSGSNSVLQRMLREYSIEHYLDILNKLRKARPGIVISTDIIAGFPNETEEEYQDTIKLLDEAQFDFIYSFTFSPRKGTKAARMDDVLTDNERGVRLRQIQSHQLKIQEKIRAPLVGKTIRVLVEDSGTMKGSFKWKGRAPSWRIVHFAPTENQQDLKWHWCDVKITSATALSYQGELVKDYGKTLPESFEVNWQNLS